MGFIENMKTVIPLGFLLNFSPNGLSGKNNSIETHKQDAVLLLEHDCDAFFPPSSLQAQHYVT